MKTVRRVIRSDAFQIFVLLFILFMITLKTVPVSDTQSNNYLPWIMIRQGTFATDFVSMSQTDYMYYPRDGHTYSTFPIGTPVAALPVYLLPSIFIGRITPMWAQLLGKTSASVMMALAAVFIFLAAGKLFDRKRALATTVLFALGTGVFAMASQMLLTFTGAILFLSMGCYFTAMGPGKKVHVLMAGFSFAFAGACQPICFLFLLLFGLHVLVRRYRDLPAYVLGALPPVALTAAYNTIAYGAPWKTGEFLAASFSVSGNWNSGVSLHEIWSTPLLKGIAITLFSPSRGIFVFSPVLLLAFVGLWVAWRKKGDLAFLLYGFAGCCVVVIAAAKWLDLGGGNCFGYRTTLSVVPFLALLAGAGLGKVLSRKWLEMVLVVLLAFSVFVQGVGYLSYDGGSWETRYLYEYNGKPRYTERYFWSGHNQLCWEVSNFKFYVPPFWQGTRPYPASVIEVGGCLAREQDDGRVRVGLVTESPRIFRAAVTYVEDGGPTKVSRRFVPRGEYTTWFEPVDAKDGTILYVGISNVGVKDGYVIEVPLDDV